MTYFHRLVLSALLVLMVWAPPAKSGCIQASDCFCLLSPSSCQVLVSAEVLAVGEQTIGLRILADPYYDPDNIIQDGDVLSDLKYLGSDLVAGDTGLFRVHPEGACLEGGFPDEPRIISFVIETEGKYLCSGFPDFDGASQVEVISAVLSDDCDAVVREMGIFFDCLSESGCCSNTMASLGNSFFLILLGLVLIPGRR